MPAGRPPKYETPEQMQEVIDLYFLIMRVRETGDLDLIMDCSDEEHEVMRNIEGSSATVSGLAYTLGMTRQGLCEYAAKDQFSDTVKKAKQRIEMYIEQRLNNPACTGAIFNLKNNFGWKDSKETVHKGAIGVAELTDDELANIATGSSTRAPK